MTDARTPKARADVPAPTEEPLLPGWDQDHDLDPYGSRMLPRFGAPLRLWARTFFDRIGDECDLAPVRKAAEEGSVVYVMRTRSRLDYLFFNHFALKHGLPLARFANGISTLGLGPVTSAFRTWWASRRYRMTTGQPLPDPVDSGFLERLVHRGDPALVFLRRGREFPFKRAPGQQDLVEVLVEAQMNREEPIFLVPQILVWERSPDRTNRGLLDVLLGDQDSPGAMRKVLFFLRSYRDAVVRIGEPVNLKEFLVQQEGQPVARIAKKLRWLLLGYLYRERKVVKGPDVRPRRWIFDRILAEPAVQREVEATAAREGRSRHAIEKRARKLLDRLGADYRWSVVMFLKNAIDVITKRIYSGVVFDEEDAERIRIAARKGTVILVPSHRSHFDYLLLSWLMFYQGMTPPHIAAGDNLAFFPMGPLFRRAGAFFIRRSFAGDPLYAQLVDRYVRTLVSEGYTQMCFIEGGRSRTGKMLQPKVGLLGYFMDAMADRVVSDIQLVPVYIAYERVVEDYSDELTGGQKKKESAGELLKAGKVLSRRFGRVYVRTNEPVSLRESLEIFGKQWQGVDRDERKSHLKRLAQHVAAEIQDATIVTPSAVASMVLLNHDQRGITRVQFLKAARFVRRWLEFRGAHFSDSWHFPEDALNETLEIFSHAKQVEILPGPPGAEDDGEERNQDIIAITQDAAARMALDYNRNTIVFHFVHEAFLCTALLLGDRENERVARVQRRFDFLRDLFQEEFVFHPDIESEVLLGQAGRRLQEHGIITVDDGGLDAAKLVRGEDPSLEPVHHWLDEAIAEGLDVRICLADWGRASVFISSIRNLFEAYYVVLKGSTVLLQGPMTEKQLVDASLREGRRMWLTEDVTRPESASKVNLANAIKVFTRKGVLRVESGAGKDALLTLDDAARERYMKPMHALFHSGRFRPGSGTSTWDQD